MKSLYLSSVVLSVLITLSLFLNYIYQQDRSDIFYFNKTYETNLKQENYILSTVSLGVAGDPGLKNAIENNFTNSINQSLKVYKTTNVDLFLFDKDCQVISKTSTRLKNAGMLCNQEKDESGSSTNGVNLETKFFDGKAKIIDLEGSNVLVNFSQIFKQSSLTYLGVVSYIDEGFFEKYPDLNHVYTKLDVKIKKASSFWASYLGRVVPSLDEQKGKSLGFVSSKPRLKIFPTFLFKHVSVFMLVLIVVMVALLIVNNVILVLKLYKDRIKLDIDIGNFFDWIKDKASKMGDNTFGTVKLLSEKSIENCKEEISRYLENLKNQLSEAHRHTSELQIKLKQENLNNKTLNIQLSYFSEIESLHVQMKHLFITLISHMEDIHREIDALNKISKEAFVGCRTGFFAILNEWQQQVKQRGSWRFLRSLYEKRSPRSKDPDRTELDDQVEELIQGGSSIYFASTTIVSKINQISSTMKKISHLFEIWQKVLYEKQDSDDFNMNDVVLDSQLLIKEEMGLREDKKGSVEFVNYNLEVSGFPKISDHTWMSFLYHVYSSWVKVASFLEQDIKIFTTFKTSGNYEYIVVGTDIKERFTAGILTKLKDIQQNDLDLAIKIVERFSVTSMNFPVTDSISPVGFRWVRVDKNNTTESQVDKIADTTNLDTDRNINTNNI